MNSSLKSTISDLIFESFSPKYLSKVEFTQINGRKLAISTERRSVNKMSFLSGVSLNFVENSIVCAKFGSTHKFTSCPLARLTCPISFKPEQYLAQTSAYSPSWPQVHWIGPRVHSLPVNGLSFGHPGLNQGHPRPEPWSPWA